MNDGDVGEDYAEPMLTNPNCSYLGTDYIDGKIWLIGFFGTSLALTSVLLNTFLCIVYFHTPSLRRSAVLYFGVIAVVDIIMGFNYIIAMSVPVIFDRYNLLWLYHLFLFCVELVICESNCAIFSSSLLILLATTERLLRTFQVKTLRRFVEKNRMSLCFSCIVISFAYKLSTYFEIEVIEYKHCPDDAFGRYEIAASAFVRQSPSYQFIWMFLTRFIVDRILPFVLLLLMNFKIIAALKQQTFEPKKLVFAHNASTKCSRRNIRDATRTLIIMVSMYIVSQAPQVIFSIWEFTDPKRVDLESPAWHEFYSYANDIISICTLLSSCLRFPVYLAHNRQINEASVTTLRDFCQPLCGKRKSQDYRPIKPPNASLTNGKGAIDLSNMEKRIEVFANGNKVLSGPTTESVITETTSNQSAAAYDYHWNEYIL